jgi:hypothetical protein
MSETSRRDEDKRRRSQSLGDLAREIFGEVPVMDNNPPPSETTYQQGYSMPSVPLRKGEVSIYRKRGFKGAENLALTGKAEQ